jgi:hypothetical protein
MEDRKTPHNEELHNLYFPPHIIRMIKSRRMGLARHVTRMIDLRNWYKILVGKCKGKRPFKRPSSRWENNIKMGLRETGIEGVDWIHVAQDRGWW